LQISSFFYKEIFFREKQRICKAFFLGSSKPNKLMVKSYQVWHILPKHPEVWHVLAKSSQIFPKVKLRTSILAKKQRYFNFLPDFRYFRICQDVLERVQFFN